MPKPPDIHQFDLDRPIEARVPGWVFVMAAGALTSIAAAVLLVGGSWAYWANQRAELETTVSGLLEKVSDSESRVESTDRALSEAQAALAESEDRVRSLGATRKALSSSLDERDREIARLMASPEEFPLIDNAELLGSIGPLRISAVLDSSAKANGLRESMVLEQMRFTLRDSPLRVQDDASDVLVLSIDLLNPRGIDSASVYNVDCSLLRRVVLPGHTHSTYSIVHQEGLFGRFDESVGAMPLDTQFRDLVAKVTSDFADSVRQARSDAAEGGG